MTADVHHLSGRIGLVEDHERLSALIKRGLEQEGIALDVYPSGASAWHGLSARAYAVAVIDRGLPDGDGLQLVRRLRAAGNRTPCLILTAREALRDRVEGLNAGADDYLPKPFAMDELAARVRALMRRPPALHEPLLVFDELYIEPENALMRRGDDSVSLAPAELQIMICLVRAAGRIVRRTTLELSAWGVSDIVTPNALDVALHRLRRKLDAVDANVALVNVRNQGFALRRQHDAA